MTRNTIDWLESVPNKDFERFVKSIEQGHPKHEFEFALVEYKGNYLGVTRCVDCQKMIGALPIPDWEYKIIKLSMETFWEFTEGKRKKRARTSRKGKSSHDA